MYSRLGMMTKPNSFAGRGGEGEDWGVIVCDNLLPCCAWYVMQCCRWGQVKEEHTWCTLVHVLADYPYLYFPASHQALVGPGKSPHRLCLSRTLNLLQLVA